MPVIEDAVVNNVLCYLSSARHSYSENSITSICQSFYNADKIYEAKEILFDISKDPVINRRGEGKVKATVLDIVSLLRKIDDNSIPCPKFVCDGYDGMPPSSGFEIIAEHMADLITEISKLRNEVDVLKQNTSSEGFNCISEMKDELKGIRDILKSTTTRSEPFTITRAVPAGECPRQYSAVVNSRPNQDHQPLNSYSQTPHTSQPLSVSQPPHTSQLFNSSQPPHNSQPLHSSQPVNSSQPPHNSQTRYSSQPHHRRHSKRVNSTQNSDQPISSLNVPQSENSSLASGSNLDVEWQIVEKRKNNKKGSTIRGSRTTNGAFKGVQETRDIYVGRCDVDVTSNVLSEYIKETLKINIIGCICLSGDDSPVKSFKVTVSADDSYEMLKDDVWPLNIRVRKYFNKRNNGGQN